MATNPHVTVDKADPDAPASAPSATGSTWSRDGSVRRDSPDPLAATAREKYGKAPLSQPARRLVLLFALTMIAFSVAPLWNNFQGWINKDYTLWYRTGQFALHGVPVYPTDHRPFPFMYPPSCAAMLAIASMPGDLPFVVLLLAINSAAWAGSVLLSVYLATGKTQMPQKQDVRSKYGIKNDFLYYPAQFWPHKNHVNLIHALKVLKDRGRAVSLVFTGADHGNQPHVEKVTRELGLADQVHFCGFVPYEDVLTFYREAMALSYVSLFGPENLPPLEAMALGCPVILSDTEGAEALHDGIPLMVNPLNPDSIADAIQRVQTDPKGLENRIAAGKTFAAANSCARYMERFQDILDGFAPIRRCWS